MAGFQQVGSFSLGVVGWLIEQRIVVVGQPPTVTRFAQTHSSHRAIRFANQVDQFCSERFDLRTDKCASFELFKKFSLFFDAMLPRLEPRDLCTAFVEFNTYFVETCFLKVV